MRPERRVYRDDSPAQQRIAWEHFGVSFRVLLLDGGDLVHLGRRANARLTRSDRLLDEMGGLALAAVFGVLGGVTKVAQQHLEVPDDQADKEL